ncbi:hypothetical protein AAC387_Pa07g3411 [Persea americana]
MQRVKVQLGVFWEHLILLLLVEACYNFESCLQVQQISFSFILSFSLIQLESMEGLGFWMLKTKLRRKSRLKSSSSSSVVKHALRVLEFLLQFQRNKCFKRRFWV